MNDLLKECPVAHFLRSPATWGRGPRRPLGPLWKFRELAGTVPVIFQEPW